MATSSLKQLWEFGRDVARGFARDRCPFLAAAVCYFVVFSLFPLILGTIALLGYVVSPDWALEQVHAGLGKALPAQLGFMAQVIDQVVAARQPSGVIALVLLLWSGRGVFMSLGEALDIIWNAHQVLGWKAALRRNAVALLLAIGVGGSVIVLTFMYGGLSLVLNFRIEGLGLRASDLPGVLWLLSSVLPVVLIGLGLVLVYRFMPIRHLPRRSIVLGAASAAILWEVGRRLFGIYLDHAVRLSLVYGSLSGVIAFLLWVYVSAMIFLLGAEIAARDAHAKAFGPDPEAASNSPSAR